MRTRIIAVVCGGLALFMAYATAAAAFLGMWQARPPVAVPWVAAAALFAIAVFAFAAAMRRDSEDDDLFEGDRGLAVTMTVLTFLGVTAFMVVMVLQPDFWRGLAGY